MSLIHRAGQVPLQPDLSGSARLIRLNVAALLLVVILCDLAILLWLLEQGPTAFRFLRADFSSAKYGGSSPVMKAWNAMQCNAMPSFMAASKAARVQSMLHC